jgi:hypothetical protein
VHSSLTTAARRPQQSNNTTNNNIPNNNLLQESEATINPATTSVLQTNEMNRSNSNNTSLQESNAAIMPTATVALQNEMDTSDNDPQAPDPSGLQVVYHQAAPIPTAYPQLEQTATTQDTLMLLGTEDENQLTHFSQPNTSATTSTTQQAEPPAITPSQAASIEAKYSNAFAICPEASKPTLSAALATANPPLPSIQAITIAYNLLNESSPASSTF